MYVLFLSQLVRYCYTNSTFSSFLKCSNKLYNKLVTQGFQPEKLQKTAMFSVSNILIPGPSTAKTCSWLKIEYVP